MKYSNIYENVIDGYKDNTLSSFMNNVYKNMGISLFISALVSYLIYKTGLIYTLFSKNILLSLIVQMAPFFYVFYFQATIFKKDYVTVRKNLFIYSALMGLSLSTIFLFYTKQSILETFLTTSLTFGCMSLYGSTTKRDLTELSSFLIMGLFGLLIASIINIFVKSSNLSLIISCVSVIVFTLFTAYDVQQIKNIYYNFNKNEENIGKLSIFGAFKLYLDFINLFISLLRFFGINKNEN